MAPSGREEVEDQKEGAETDTGPGIRESDGGEEEIGWLPVYKMNAILQIPGFAKVDLLVSHGGTAFQGAKPVRTCEAV